MRVEWGATRTVILIGRYAVKLPGRWIRYPHTQHWRSLLNGLLANMQEREWWRDSPHREHLCPVVAALPGGWLLVMRRAAPFTQPDLTQLWADELTLTVGDTLRTVEYFTTRDGDQLPGEIKESSLGWVDGRLVITDYGN